MKQGKLFCAVNLLLKSKKIEQWMSSSTTRTTDDYIWEWKLSLALTNSFENMESKKNMTWQELGKLKHCTYKYIVRIIIILLSHVILCCVKTTTCKKTHCVHVHNFACQHQIWLLHKKCRLELNMELPAGQQSQPIGTASSASAEQVNCFLLFCLFQQKLLWSKTVKKKMNQFYYLVIWLF